MALNIKNPEVERLATEVAQLARETKTEAIRRALEERKARLKVGPSREEKYRRTMEFLRAGSMAAHPAGRSEGKS